MMDKAFWQAAQQADYAVPDGHTATELMPALLAGLSATDPELRDSLCYEFLATWIQRGHFSPDDCRAMLPQLLATLRAGIGTGENDRVFGRTFAALILGELVARDGKNRFLRLPELHTILDAALAYLADEQDLRGYVPTMGWAHSAAHTADLLAALATHPALGTAELRRLLIAIGEKVLTPTPYAFVDGEGFRLGQAVLAVIRREVLPVTQVGAWIVGVGGSERHKQDAAAGGDNAWKHNTTALLSAVHLMLTYQDVPPAARADLLPAVHRALKSFLPWFL